MADIDATLKEITADIRTIVRGEIELAKAEVVPGAKKAGLGVGLFAGAGVVAILAVNVLFLCLGFVYTNLFWGNMTPPAAFGLGFLCAAVTYLIIAAILALIGFLNVKKLRKPTAAIAQAEQTAGALEYATSAGLAEVRAITTRGKKVFSRDETGQLVTVYAGPRRIDDSPAKPLEN